MALKLKAVRSKETITLHLDGEVITIQKKKSKDVFEEVAALLDKQDENEIIKRFSSIRERIEKFTKGNMKLNQAGQVIMKGSSVAMPDALVKKLLELEQAGENFMPFIRFWKKLKDNPSENSRKQLYTYIDKNRMTITEMGDIVFEKGVSKKPNGAPEEFVDTHFGATDYTIGCYTEMPRDRVEDNPNKTCSAGLHVAPPEYVRSIYSSNVILECIVNPADVVSVPTDYNQRKIRVCKLKVVGYAPKMQRSNQVVKLSDFITDMPDHMKNAEEKERTGVATAGTRTLKQGAQVKIGKNQKIHIEITDAEQELKGKTAKEIVQYVYQKTGKRITRSSDPRKAQILPKAIAALDEYNKEQGKALENEINKPEEYKKRAADEIEGKTAKQIISHVNLNYQVDLSHLNVKNKNKIIKEAVAIIAAHLETQDSQGQLSEQQEVIDVKPTQEKQPKKVVELSTMNKKQMVRKVKDKFNEKIGGFGVSESTVRERATKLFQDAGYEVK